MKKSFTLIELMVTVTIIGIIIGMAVPKYDKYILKGRFNSEAVTTIQALAMAQEQYKQETGYYYPKDYKDSNVFMNNGDKIEEFLRIDLSNTNNFLYSIKTNSDGDEFVIHATLRKSGVWGNDRCDDLDDSESRCVASLKDHDDWVNNYLGSRLSHYFIEYKYPTNDSNNLNGINYSNMLTH